MLLALPGVTPTRSDLPYVWKSSRAIENRAQLREWEASSHSFPIPSTGQELAQFLLALSYRQCLAS